MVQCKTFMYVLNQQLNQSTACSECSL